MATMNDNDSGGVKTPNSKDHVLMRENIDYRHGIYFTLCSLLFFQVINWVVKSQGPPKNLREDEWKWRNLYVSRLHAFLVSIWILLSILLYPEFLWDLLDHVNYFTYFNVCFATAYFVYDLLDMLVNNKILKMWEVTCHHIAVLMMFIYNIIIIHVIGFNLVALFVEFNTFFLHWRKLLQMVGTSYSSRRYVIVKYANLISFAICRFGACGAITTAVIFWRLRVSVYYYACICTSMVFMNILNVILFWRLLKSDVLRPRADGPRSSACQNVRKDCQAMNGYESVGKEDDVNFNHTANHSIAGGGGGGGGMKGD